MIPFHLHICYNHSNISKKKKLNEQFWLLIESGESNYFEQSTEAISSSSVQSSHPPTQIEVSKNQENLD